VSDEKKLSADELAHLERYAQAMAWKEDPSKLKEWVEVRSLVVLQRLEAIASLHPSAEIAEKSAKQFLVMAKALIDALHQGKLLDEKKAKRA
jgi:hypothetical protein